MENKFALIKKKFPQKFVPKVEIKIHLPMHESKTNSSYTMAEKVYDNTVREYRPANKSAQHSTNCARVRETGFLPLLRHWFSHLNIPNLYFSNFITI